VTRLLPLALLVALAAGCAHGDAGKIWTAADGEPLWDKLNAGGKVWETPGERTAETP